jgi:hypothetical protein
MKASSWYLNAVRSIFRSTSVMNAMLPIPPFRTICVDHARNKSNHFSEIQESPGRNEKKKSAKAVNWRSEMVDVPQ